MDREAYLIEQIESYIDQLDLLGMQETIDQTRIDNVVARVSELVTEYDGLLGEQAEVQIQEIEGTYVETLEDEHEKRKKILAVVNKKLQTIVSLGEHVKEIKVATKLQEHIGFLIAASEKQVGDYEEDLKLVEDQLDAIQKAEALESDLKSKREEAYSRTLELKNAQISYATLNDEILKVYSKILLQGNAAQIDFNKLEEDEERAKKRQNQFLENLELAKTAKDAKKYVADYEARIKRVRLELDEISEKHFFHLLGKMKNTLVDSYQSLENRTKPIEAMIHSRLSQVEQLYQEGIVEREEYRTYASQIDHSEIFRQIDDLKEIAKKENLIESIDEQLKHTRDTIKSQPELEKIFIERATERGRTARIPEAPVTRLTRKQEPEILFGDEGEFALASDLNPVQKKKDKRKRQVISMEPAKVRLLEKVEQAKAALLEASRKAGMISETAKEKMTHFTAGLSKYQPTIGDKITLGEMAKVYSDPMNVITEKDGKDAASANLYNTELFITRGVILDYTDTPIYITTAYGINLDTIAKNMNLAPGTYHIALGCSIGDENGKFIPASSQKINPVIEKGWISATESDLIVLDKLTEDKKKGGMVK